MIFTPCESCWWYDGRGACSLKQYAIVPANRLVAPGFCRLCRSRQWAEQHLAEGVDLREVARREIWLQADLVLVFNEKDAGLSELRASASTLRCKWIKNLVLIDTTGADQRTGVAGTFVADKALVSRPYKLDVRIESGMTFQEAVNRGARLATSPYFLAMTAGECLTGDGFEEKIGCESRFGFWAFPRTLGHTPVVNPFDGHGLYLKEAFLHLDGNSPDQTFIQKLRLLEPATGLALIGYEPGGMIRNV